MNWFCSGGDTSELSIHSNTGMTLNNVGENTFQLEKVLFYRNQNSSRRIKYRTYANQLTVLNHMEKTPRWKGGGGGRWIGDH